MSYLAKLLAVYRERARLESLDGFITPDSYFRTREIAELLISDGCRRAEGVAA